MDFLRIGESKIKIVLTSDEVTRYGISAAEDGSVGASRRSVWEILDAAKAECGFDAHGDKVLVQFYPMKRGCEMFVTKLGILESDSARTVSRSERVTLISRCERFYSFPDRSSLLSAVREIVRRFTEHPESSLYTDGESYALSVVEHAADQISSLSFLSEFADPLPREISPYISEHFDTLYTGDAIEKILE